MVELSLPKSRSVRGYEIRRLPLGKYLQAMEMLRQAPERIICGCFPDKSTQDALREMRHIDAQKFLTLAVSGTGAALEEIVRLLALAMDIDETVLLTDENVGLDGLAEMAEAFWELNGIGNFIVAVKALSERIMSPMNRAATGCSGSL